LSVLDEGTGLICVHAPLAAWNFHTSPLPPS
jgi:hypothetical protein